MPAAPPQVPLVVDLDGTLLRTDLMWESLAQCLRRNPFSLFQILCWWTRGRARLKQKLAVRVRLDPAALPYNEKFLAYLRAEKKAGRTLVLATASDMDMARPVADFTGLFDEVLASDGRTNLRSENKLRVLVEKFGERGFDYAGNSSADFAVWRGAREAVVVNASRRVRLTAATCTRLGPVFCDDFSPVAIARSVVKTVFWDSGYLLAIFAGLFLASAFPGLNLAGFAWLAPGLMLAAAAGKSGADALRAGYVAGLAFWLATLDWLLRIPVTGFPILGWISLAAYLALFTAAWVWLVAQSTAKNPETDSWNQRTAWALGGAAAWVALEFLRGWLFGGFPWNHLGDSQFRLVPLIQIASGTGVYGVSFLVVWFSLGLLNAARMIYRHPTRRFAWQAEIVLPLTATVGCFIGGFFTLNHQSPVTDTLRVTLIQPAFAQTLIWSPTEDARRFQELLDLSQRALTNHSDLLLWPESAVPDLDDATYRTINEFAQSNRIWIMLNGDDVEFSPAATNYFNTALLAGPAGGRWQIYHKRQLVIFGEYVPLARWLPWLRYFTPITGGWTPGDKPVTFRMSRTTAAETKLISISNDPTPAPRRLVKIGPLICYEDVFPEIGRDTADDDLDVLVNLTNDGWFGRGSAQWQQAAAAVFRAVENGLPLVRCANNGVSCLIDAHGRVQSVLTGLTGDVHDPGTLTVEVPLLDRHEPTYYHRHGDWFACGCVILTAAGVARIIIPRRRP